MEYSGGVSVGARATHMQTHTRVHTPQSWLLILRIDQPIYRSYRSLFPGLKRRQTDRRTDKQTGQWSVWEDYQWTADSIIVQWTFRGFCWLHTHKHTQTRSNIQLPVCVTVISSTSSHMYVHVHFLYTATHIWTVTPEDTYSRLCFQHHECHFILKSQRLFYSGFHRF